MSEQDKTNFCKMIEQDQKDFLCEFARRSFRDMADKDYLLARLCVEYGLIDHFAWNALQAIEKYLKSILLFNLKSTIRDDSKKCYGHDIKKLASAVSILEDIDCRIPERFISTFDYFHDRGMNRYGSIASFFDSKYLVALDEFVCFIRRYCQPLEDIRLISQSPEKLKIFNEKEKFYELQNGYLESKIQSNSAAGEVICFQNTVFGQVTGEQKAITLPESELIRLGDRAEIYLSYLEDYVLLSKSEKKRLSQKKYQP